MDKSHSVISFSLDLSVIEYQTAVLRKDFTAAEEIFSQIQEKDRTRIAQFLESNGHHRQALKITMDPDHKFELAIYLGELKIAHDIAENDKEDAEHKWKQIADLALTNFHFKLAEKAMHKSNDLSGLLMLYTSLADASGVEKLAALAVEHKRYNIAFTCLLLLGRVNACLDLLVKSGKIPEAVFMARSYAPSRVSQLVALWREEYSKTNPKMAQSLADPQQYPNLFDQYEESLKAESYFHKEKSIEDLPDAIRYCEFASSLDGNLIQELQYLVESNQHTDTPQEHEEPSGHTDTPQEQEEPSGEEKVAAEVKIEDKTEPTETVEGQ